MPADKLPNIFDPVLLSCIPVLAVEEIKPEFWSEMGKETLPNEGGLYPERLPKIKSVHIIFPSAAQVYWVRNLRRGPHYNVPRAFLGLYMEVLIANEISFQEYNANASYIDTSNRENNSLPYVQVVNYGTDEFRTIEHLYSQLHLKYGKDLIGDNIETLLPCTHGKTS